MKLKPRKMFATVGDHRDKFEVHSSTAIAEAFQFTVKPDKCDIVPVLVIPNTPEVVAALVKKLAAPDPGSRRKPTDYAVCVATHHLRALGLTV